MKLCPLCKRCYDDADSVCREDQSGLVQSRPGTRLIADKYRLDQLLGRGGMGAVYAGTHLDLERPVAIKLLLPDFTADADALERFRREARAAAHIDHPNVADTYDYGLLPDGGSYIVMQLVVGQTLREYMDAAGALPFLEALNISGQIADGIEAAHRRGIVHRDLKPSNIILTRDHQEQLQAKVVDFGVAKLKEQTTTGAGGLTASGSLIGTPRYMSPEQCSGHGADARSDIYSLGVMLFEMLAARPPFDAPSATAIAIKHIQQPPPLLKEFRADVPPALEALVSRLLDKNPDQRPQTAVELTRELHRLASTLQSDETFVHNLNGSPALKTQSAGAANVMTNPNTDDLKETNRTGTPTVEQSIDVQPDNDVPSVEAFAAVPDTVTAVATPLAAAAEELTRTPQAQIKQAEPSRMANDESSAPTAYSSQRRSPLFRYLILGAIVFGLSFGAVALWLVMRNRQPEAGASSNNQAPVARQAEDEKAASSDTRTATTNDATARSVNNNAAAVSPTPSTNKADERAQLRAALDEWIATTNSGDLARQMNLYVPVLERFYQKRNVARTAARAEKERVRSGVTSFSIQVAEPEMTISADGRTATMLFRKSYSSGGAQGRSGAVVQELRWVKTAEGWRITSERDVSVIR